MPTALVAPAGSKPRHDEIPSARLYPQRHGVTVRAAISLREDKEKNDRGRDEAKNEKADEDDGKDDSVRHRDFSLPLQALFHLKPRLNVSQIALDPLYYDFGSCVDCDVIEAAGS